MTVPTYLPKGEHDVDFDSSDTRPLKRTKVLALVSTTLRADEQNDGALVRRHPLGLRPSGNALTSSTNLRDASGLFARCPDELIAQLLDFFDAANLLHLGATCRALHAFTRNEELWRTLFVESSPAVFEWQGTWRSTYLAQSLSREPKVNCSNLFSDVLHRPFFCAHVPLHSYATQIPKQNEIARLANMTYDEFAHKWYNQPFILTDPVKQWPVYTTWSTERLIEKYAKVAFRAEAVDWPLEAYVGYMSNNHDESPLYLFDRAFVEKMNLTVSSAQDDSADYWPPACYGPDSFSVLGKERPDHRWLIVGPERSGSTFHKDPNATSAWNAVLKGRKYWIMFPSSPSIPPPPGVYVTEDQSEVTSPLSIAEWLLGFHEEARRTSGCKEGICEEGEILYVPSGWYHLVLNLEASIAITQNLVPRERVGAVLHFLRTQSKNISGFGDDVGDPYGLFVERLRMQDPELLDVGLEEEERLDRLGKNWQQLTKTTEDDDEGATFSFGFGGDDDDEVVL